MLEAGVETESTVERPLSFEELKKPKGDGCSLIQKTWTVFFNGDIDDPSSQRQDNPIYVNCETQTGPHAYSRHTPTANYLIS